MGVTAQKRMSKGERRHQLLDVAASLLAEGDTQNVTMERVAEHAGVSKALPYAHFENAEQLLVTLYRRASVELGEAIWQALEDAGDDDDLADVWADAYYHCSITQGVVFAALGERERPSVVLILQDNKPGRRQHANVRTQFISRNRQPQLRQPVPKHKQIS